MAVQFCSGLKRLARVAFFVLAGSLIVEVGLRLAGAGFEPGFFLDREDGYTVINQRFGRLFYPEELVRGAYPARFRTVKDAGTFRVFVLGESAAAGYPDPSFSASRVLGQQLARACPEETFEVINTGVTALNSHAIRRIAVEATRYQPDAVIVYMGNNEVVGPFGPGSVLGGGAPSLALARMLVAFRSTRIGQMLQSLADGLTRAGRPRAWGGMEMFDSAWVPSDSESLEVAYRSFASNLSNIVKELQESGVPVILCTIASNLTDCPPLAAGRADGPGVAAEAYRRGREAAQRGRAQEALRLLRDARDADLLRFRADRVINETIREVALADGCVLVDAEENFACAQLDNSSGSNPLFYEHVHFTFAGNALLSTLWAEALAAVFAERMPCLAAVKSSSSEDLAFLADSLGYTALARGYSIGTILGMLERPPFNSQLGQADRTEYWRSQLRSIEEQLTPDYVAECILRLERRAHLDSHDGSIAYWLGRHHEDQGDLQAAVACYEKSLEVLPDNPVVWLQLGDAYRRLGLLPQARVAYQQVSRIFPADPISKERLQELGVGSP